MKFVLYTIACSPHQTPLFKELMGYMGIDNCRYVAVRPPIKSRTEIGWKDGNGLKCVMTEQEERKGARVVLENADALLCGIRDLALFRKRCEKNMLTIYSSERWFKPMLGMLRLLSPVYCMMAWRFVGLLRKSWKLYYFPIGVHAARDMARLCGLFAGDLRCIFRAPDIEFDRRPGGRILLKDGGDGRKYCLDKMRLWGYFVEPSKYDAHKAQEPTKSKPAEIKVLWVGRLLNLKRADNSLPKITLDIYGKGPDEHRLRKLAKGYEEVIRFHSPVSIDVVRKLMREHDVYVLSSNACEGWGSVVSEALEEGMIVIGTYEAGSSATMLPASNLFHAGAYKALANKLLSDLKLSDNDAWSTRNAAFQLIKAVLGE